jgi:hypothetical protein
VSGPDVGGKGVLEVKVAANTRYVGYTPLPTCSKRIHISLRYRQLHIPELERGKSSLLVNFPEYI